MSLLHVRVSCIEIGKSYIELLQVSPARTLYQFHAEGTPDCLSEQRLYRSFRVLLSPDLSCEDIASFGRYGLVEFSDEPVALDASVESATRLYVTGGKQHDANASLRGLLRLQTADHRLLVQLMKQYEEVHCSVVANKAELAPNVLVLASGDAQPLQRLLHYLPALTFIAAPFLIPRSADAQCVAPSSGHYDSGNNYSGVDFSHLSVDEGGVALNGYVPSSSSGVTIAGGLDLGVHLASDLANIGIPSNLIQQFQPFLAIGPGQYRTGKAAKAAVAANPSAAAITADQATQIDQITYNFYTTKVAAAFNEASPSMIFTDLNVQWQTAVASMYLQSQNIPNTQFFTQVANGQWSNAIANLQNFGGPSAQNNRAKRVADYLTNSKCTTGTN